MDCIKRLAFFGELRRYIVSSMLLKSASDNMTTWSPLTRVTTVGAWSLQTSSITVFKLARASLKVRMFMIKLLPQFKCHGGIYPLGTSEKILTIRG
jgi:hypothetical protein